MLTFTFPYIYIEYLIFYKHTQYKIYVLNIHISFSSNLNQWRKQKYDPPSKKKKISKRINVSVCCRSFRSLTPTRFINVSIKSQKKRRSSGRLERRTARWNKQMKRWEEVVAGFLPGFYPGWVTFIHLFRSSPIHYLLFRRVICWSRGASKTHSDTFFFFFFPTSLIYDISTVSNLVIMAKIFFRDKLLFLAFIFFGIPCHFFFPYSASVSSLRVGVCAHARPFFPFHFIRLFFFFSLDSYFFFLHLVRFCS